MGCRFGSSEASLDRFGPHRERRTIRSTGTMGTSNSGLVWPISFTLMATLANSGGKVGSVTTSEAG